mmetsp:Transcript_11360/g.16977  ORF Transcript_11360/g.16977 Transcript_11360/m.16977 type:complete len:210 (+) Transcript_11360:708-1337(+)
MSLVLVSRRSFPVRFPIPNNSGFDADILNSVKYRGFGPFSTLNFFSARSSLALCPGLKPALSSRESNSLLDNSKMFVRLGDFPYFAHNFWSQILKVYFDSLNSSRSLASVSEPCISIPFPLSFPSLGLLYVPVAFSCFHAFRNRDFSPKVSFTPASFRLRRKSAISSSSRSAKVEGSSIPSSLNTAVSLVSRKYVKKASMLSSLCERKF